MASSGRHVGHIFPSRPACPPATSGWPVDLGLPSIFFMLDPLTHQPRDTPPTRHLSTSIPACRLIVMAQQSAVHAHPHLEDQATSTTRTSVIVADFEQVSATNTSIPAYPMLIENGGITDLSMSAGGVGIMRNGVLMFRYVGRPPARVSARFGLIRFDSVRSGPVPLGLSGKFGVVWCGLFCYVLD